jgi:high-affinity iron transporter
MNLIYATLFLALSGGSGTDSAVVARRVAASAQLAAQEYRMGVVGGKIVAEAEVEEARLFLTEAIRTARTLPVSVAGPTVTGLEQALALVQRTSMPDSVDLVVRGLTDGLAKGLGVVLDEIPERSPSLARGKEIYQRECASCHGDAGAGDGPAGKTLTPLPANLSDHTALADVTPLAFYQRITIGVAGTAMPAYESRLPLEDRWAVAAYASTLRQAAPLGDVPASLRTYPAVAKLNDAEILAALGPGATREQVSAVRHFESREDRGADVAAAFAAVRGKVSEATTLAGDGQHDAAVSAALDAYLAFEKVERSVRNREPSLATKLEASFATLRTRVAGGATVDELRAMERGLAVELEQAERAIGDTLSPFNLFLQSLAIILREGIEAILIIGALMAFLVRVGAGHRRRDIHIGVGAAVALSLLTAVLLETVFQLSPANQEVLEGLTMVTAVVVLFYVSYWLLSKMEVQKWTAFVKGRVQEALTGGSVFALASAAFLAVYREGFETVLFYKALFVSGGSTGGTFLPVVSGIALGGLILSGIYVAINKYGVKLPLRPFFAVTSAFLYYTAFVFAGKAVAELQAGSVLPTSILLGWPRLPALGIYPTVESMLAQGLLLALALGALGWIFLVQRPRDARRFAAEAAAAAAPNQADPMPSRVEDGPGVEKAVLRSLERMEGDLAAIRSEVERLKQTVVDSAVSHES